MKTDGRVGGAVSREAEESVISFGGIAEGISSSGGGGIAVFMDTILLFLKSPRQSQNDM